MKNKTIKYAAILFSLIMGGVVGGCNDADYSELGVHAYIAEAESSLGTKITIGTDETTSTTLTIRLSDKLDKATSFELVPDQSALDKYNKVNGTNYVLLPEDSYTLPCKIVVEAGQYVAAKTMINIKPFTKEMNESGEQYALPLRLYSKDKIVPTMKQSGIYVIATGSIIKFSAPILGHMTATAVDMTPGDITLNEYTVEMRFQIDKMGRNNQALFSATANNG